MFFEERSICALKDNLLDSVNEYNNLKTEKRYIFELIYQQISQTILLFNPSFQSGNRKIKKAKYFVTLPCCYRILIQKLTIFCIQGTNSVIIQLLCEKFAQKNLCDKNKI